MTYIFYFTVGAVLDRAEILFPLLHEQQLKVVDRRSSAVRALPFCGITSKKVQILSRKSECRVQMGRPY